MSAPMPEPDDPTPMDPVQDPPVDEPIDSYATRGETR